MANKRISLRTMNLRNWIIMRNANENKQTKGHNNRLMARVLPGLSETSESLQL